MAHPCFNCGSECYCHGDIDDVIVSHTPTGCEGCDGCEMMNEAVYDDEWPEDDVYDDDPLELTADYSHSAIALQALYESIGCELDMNYAEDAWKLVMFLRDQNNHSAESIACYLQLRGLFNGYVPDLIAALIKEGVCKH